MDGALNLPHGADWTFTLDFNGNNKHNLAKMRLAISSAENPAIHGIAIPENTSTALARLKSGEKLQSGQMVELANWYKTRDEDWKKLNQAVEDVLATQPKASLAKALISSEGVPAVRLHTQGADFYDPVHLLKRGDLNQKVSVAAQRSEEHTSELQSH